MLENTIVMFFADHGRPMPWGKQWLSVEGLQVPLIVRAPGVTAGSHEQGLVSLIDLAPSMLEVAGLPIPEWMEGRPLLGRDFPKRDHIFAARDRCGDAMDRIRAVISEDNLLVRNFYPELSRLNWSSYKEGSYPGMPLLRVMHDTQKLEDVASKWLEPRRPEVEFYDLSIDPQGLIDVAENADYASVVGMKHNDLDNWIEATHDQGIHGDPSTEPPLAQIQGSKRADYNRTWKKRLNKPEPADQERVAWWEQIYGL